MGKNQEVPLSQYPQEEFGECHSGTVLRYDTACQLNEEALERPLQSEAAPLRGDGADLSELGPGSLVPCLLAS
jgi:hypothetical protein